MKNKDGLTYFIDLDGTLFDKSFKTRISKKNLSTILLLKNFANVVISTGRSYNDQKVKQTLYQLGLNDIICSSGAEIYIDNNKVYSFEFEKETILELSNFCIKNKILFVIFDKKGESIYVNSRIAKWISKTFLFKKFKIIDYTKNFDINKHKNIIKMAFILKNSTTSDVILKKIKLLFGSKINAYLASANFVIEITDSKINKGIAEALYMKHHKINIKDTVHIGDSDSDASVKGYVGKLVAMKNAFKSLKVVADEIAPHYKKAGLYKYFINKKKDKND